jgi:hypothetical protein
LAAAGKPLAGHASGDAQANAQNPAYGLRFHPDYDGTSEDCRPAFHS